MTPAGLEAAGAAFGAKWCQPPELTVTPSSISPWSFRAVPLGDHLLPAIRPGAIALHSRTEVTAAELFTRL